MLYVIAEQLGFPGILNLIRYISFRAGAAAGTALLIGLLLGPWFIGWLRVRQGKGQPIRADGPQSHLAKRGTPTMGGLLILIAVTVSVLLWMNLANPYVWACLLVTAGFGLIGWLDDYDKVKKAHHAGLAPAVLDAQVDELILIGEEMRPLAELVVGKLGLDLARDVEDATETLLRMLRPGDAVLVKASNSVGLAKLVDRMVKAQPCST
jgi:hypothetical protein